MKTLVLSNGLEVLANAFGREIANETPQPAIVKRESYERVLKNKGKHRTRNSRYSEK